MDDNDPRQQDVSTQLTKLTIQFDALYTSISDIKASLHSLTSIDKMVSELMIHSTQTRDNVKKLWERYDAVKHWQSQRENQEQLLREEIDNATTKVSQVVQMDITSIDKKVDAWINRASGAWWVIGIVMSFIVAGIFSVVVWILSTMIEVRDISKAHEIRIETMEKK